MHNLPGIAGVAGHSGSSPMWAVRSVFPCLASSSSGPQGWRDGRMCSDDLWEIYGFWERVSLETSVVLIEGYFPNDRVTVRFP